MAMRKSTIPRRRELRRTLKEPPRVLRWVSRRQVIWPSLLLILFATGASVIALNGQSRERFKVGQILTGPIVARVDAGGYSKGELIVHAGDELERSKLDDIKTEHRDYLKSLGPAGRWLVRAGGIATLIVVTLGLWAYLAVIHPNVLTRPLSGLSLTALLLSCQALAVYATAAWPQWLYAVASFPTLLATLVLAIAYDQRFATAVGAFLTLMVTVSLGLSVGFAVVLLVGVGAAVMLLSDVRTRTKLVWQVGAAAGLAMGVTTWMVCLAERPLHVAGVYGQITADSLLALGTGLFTGMFTLAILPVIERVFKVTTSMTLKDLNDASHPLLRRLAAEAPGTYAHSLRMADMGEAAADAIGANGLLCRVGAMYHDIGKINKPKYFVENQDGGPNRHTKLTPPMSLLIIVGHVKDGAEMAREYGLPPAVRHFIDSHHGTTLVEYFYHAARQQHLDQGTQGPTEFEFRYPGPKPSTKEAAIIMLCDGVESAIRTLGEPNLARIEQLVHQMAIKRLMDGQFDQCHLTLQELHVIEETLTKTVRALYHGRVAYPQAQAPAPKEREAS